MNSPRILKLPPGFDEYQNESTRPRRVSGSHVKVWLRFWWGGINPDTYLRTLVQSGQLVPVDHSPFRRKRMFVTEDVLRWAMENGAGEKQH